MRTEIASRLSDIEARYGVRILYACESGSRAWDFASSDSDWDVRFIYAHTLPWYLSVNEQRDVIELPIIDDLDISGWELRKALRLMRKSNPVLFEWLYSPICYRADDKLLAAIRSLAMEYYSPAACFHHYLHMAHRNWREYLHGPTVKLKKYLYVLRPVLACRWIEAGKGIPPVKFARLVETMVNNDDVGAAIDALVAIKRTGGELGEGPAIPEIDTFLSVEMPRLEQVAASLPKPAGGNNEGLNAFLLDTICQGADPTGTMRS